MKERAIALGFFDGVHLGHAALLRRAVEAAAERGVTPAVFTFDRPPWFSGCMGSGRSSWPPLTGR